MKAKLLCTIVFVSLLSSFCITRSQEGTKYRVGLFIVATGRYISFVQPLIKSAEKYFLPGHDRTFVVFTDHLDELIQQNNVIGIYQNRLGWPYDTMLRCKMYAEQEQLCSQFDYIYACDSDFLFVDNVQEEILGDRVAVIHPGYAGSLGTPEKNSLSTACIYEDDNQKHYFAGGLYGGTSDEFVKINQTMLANINDDLQKGIIAVWHDESHLNKYFACNPPTTILSPSYCYPEGVTINYHPRILALLKDHKAMRNS